MSSASPPPFRWLIRLVASLAFLPPLLYLLTYRSQTPTWWRYSPRLALVNLSACTGYLLLLRSYSWRLPRWAASTRAFVVAAVVVLTASAVVAEGLLRLTDRAPYSAIADVGRHRADPTLGHTFAPNYHQVLQTREWRQAWHSNSQGLRAKRDYGPKPDTVVRLLVLGDSFTAGEQVPLDSTFPGTLRQLFAHDPGLGMVEVINAGVPAYGTVLEARDLARLGPSLTPDVIILAVTPNDVGENLDPLRVTARDGALVTVGTTEGAIAQWRDRQEWYSVPGLVERSLLVQAIGRALPRTRPYAHRLAFAATQTPAGAAAWRAFDDAVGQIEHSAADLGATVAIVAIPFREEVLNRLGPGLDPTMFGRRVADIAARHAIPMLDLLPAFRAAPNPQSLYWREDPHCTAAGYRLIGQQTHEFLLDQGMMPKRGTAPPEGGAANPANLPSS